MSKTISAALLSIDAISLSLSEPYTWASGIRSPIYCDNRLILTAPAVRTLVETAIVAQIQDMYPACEILMGTATAGIAHAAIAAYILNLPMGYVRQSSKGHGKQNQIEGKLMSGQKVVVIEDLISTASSAIEAVEALREAGAEVLGIISIFTYNMARGCENLKRAKIECTSLTDFDTVIEVAAEQGKIQQNDVDTLLAFRDNPSDESWIK